MGYRLTPRARHILFEDDTDFPGLDMRAHGITLGEWQELKFPAAFDLFADRLIEWNLEDERGNPVPPTREGVRSVDAGVVKAILFNWVDHSTGVFRSPLDDDTGGGQGSDPPDPAIEATIPMDAPDVPVSANSAA